MSRFSQHLIKRRLLTQEQLEEALQHQAVYGARLGTNLVELRMIRVDRLAEALAEFHRVALPPRPWLERPKRSAVERVTRPLVERIRFIPLRLEGSVLHAAVLDPNDPRTLDDLRFATGCRIQPYVLPEIWMHDWLFALFKLPRGIRHVETDVEPERELNEPAQDFDFQAAQAAQAALAAKAARIMVPATVGIVSGDSKPPAEDHFARKTLQGAEGRASLPGDPRPTPQGGAKRQTLQGEVRSPFADLKAAPPSTLRQTLQGEVRSPFAEPKPGSAPQRKTLQGEVRSPFADLKPAVPGERAALPPVSPVLNPLLPGRPAPGEARPTMQGAMRPAEPRSGPASAAEGGGAGDLRISPPFEGRPSSPGDPRSPAGAPRTSTGQGAERVDLSELGGPVIDRPPAEAPTRSGGASVRPPPISMRSLTELSGRASQAHPPPYGMPAANAQALELAVPWGEEVTGRISQALPPPPTTSSPVEFAASAPSEAAPEPPAPPAAPVEVAAPPAVPSARAMPPRELTDLESALRQVEDREQLIELSFEIASRFARVVALFIVHRGMVQGVRCIEDGATRSVQGVLVPLQAAGMLSQAAGQVLPFRVDPRQRPLDARVAQLLTERVTTEVSLFPVTLKTRVVNLLYASHGGEPLGTIAFGALSHLAAEMGAAYGRLILSRKGTGT